jgi:hypothetical protein
MQLLDVRREPSQLAGDRGEQRVADMRLGGDEIAEPVARQDDRLGRAQRRGGRGARGAVEERQLAEDRAGLEGREDGLVARLGRL